MHKFRIEMTSPSRGKVWIDDMQMQHVTAISFKAAIDSMVEITLTMHASEIVASGEIETTCIEDTARTFRKAGA